MRSRSDSGFSLLELMVTVLIIGILLAIALPSFLGARDRAHDRQAESSVRNTQTTIAALMADPDGPDGDPLTVLEDAEPAYTYTYGPSTDPNEVSIAVYAGAISLSGFHAAEANPQVEQWAWFAVTASRSDSGRCMVGVRHQFGDNTAFDIEDISDCQASLLDLTAVEAFLEDAGHTGEPILMWGPDCEEGCFGD